MTQKDKDRERFERNSRMYKLLANAKRLEILDLLASGEKTVTEIVNSMGIRKANVSQHLALLRYLKFVTVKRVGKNAFYNISDPRIAETSKVLDEICKSKNLNI